MQIVIDIPDDIYSAIVKQYRKDKELQTRDNLYKIIVNGTVLPKGHGKIVDLGKIDEDRIEQYNPIIYLTVNGEYIEAVSLDYLNGLQAIIEEDKEVSE